MATGTYALDGLSYTFKGYGVNSPLYEKGFPLQNYAGDLSGANFTSLCTDLSLFTWMRVLISGGDVYRGNADLDTRHCFAKKQASLLASMNAQAGPFRYIVSPYSAPGSTLAIGRSDALVTPNALVATDMLYTDNDTNWQLFLDQVDDGIKKLMLAGCNPEIFCLNNECDVTSSNLNFWFAYLDTSTKALNYVKKVWLGTGLSGGGIKARFPQFSFCFDMSNGPGSSYSSAAAADGTVAPECTYWGQHSYTEGLTGSASSPFAGNTIFTEYGSTTTTAFGSITYADLRGMIRNSHDAICYVKAPITCYWTSLRDISALQTRGYSARPLFNLSTGGGSYTRTPYWWGLKPYLVASGRGDSTALKSSSNTTAGDANFDLAAGTYVTIFQRASDSKWCIVYANFSGSNRTGDVLAFTVGGSAHDMSGTATDYDVMGGSAGAPGAASTTAGSYTFGTVTNGHIILLEMS